MGDQEQRSRLDARDHGGHKRKGPKNPKAKADDEKVKEEKGEYLPEWGLVMDWPRENPESVYFI